MKKTKILLLSFFILILTSCSMFKGNKIPGNLTNITTPKTKLKVSGVWKKTDEINLYENSEENKSKDSDIFISKSVIAIDDNYILNPSINTKYVNFKSYTDSKFIEIPKNINLNFDAVKVYEFYNNMSFSQEFIKVDENKMLTFKLGKIIIYERKSEINKDEEDKKFLEVQSLVRGETNIAPNDFGLAIAFRERNTESEKQVDYDYYTYYIKKSKNDDKPTIIKTNDIVVPKQSGLWTITTSVKDSQKNDSKGGFKNFTLAANPTFIDESKKINNISDTVYRRIDYVNQDYIAVTNYDYLSDSIAQSYNIFNMAALANKEPLKITNIAGNTGKEILITRFNENARSLFNKSELSLLPATPDFSNIGMRRIANNWQYISNINLDSKFSGNKVSTEFTIGITPVLNLDSNENRLFTWRDIIARRPGAIDATVSPDKKYILIQTSNSLEFYPIYYSYIGTTPLFSIQNVNGYEIVMTNWISQENIDSLYKEYDKLEKLNSYIIQP